MLTVITPPSFTAQPKDCNTNLGPSSPSRRVPGAARRYYQWRKNGLDIPNAIGSTLTLAKVQMDDAGSYSAYVSNPTGGINSTNAILRVAGPPLSPSAEAELPNGLGQPGRPDNATVPFFHSQPSTTQP